MYFLDIAGFRLWYGNPLTGFWRKKRHRIYDLFSSHEMYVTSYLNALEEEEKEPSSGSFINFLLICWNVFEKEKQKGGAFMKADDARVIVWQLADVVSVTKEVHWRVTGSENTDSFFCSVIRLESRAKSFYNKQTNSDYFCKVSYYFQLTKRSIKSLSKCNDKLFESCFFTF